MRISSSLLFHLPSQMKEAAPPKRMSGTNVLHSRIEADIGTKTNNARALTPFSPFSQYNRNCGTRSWKSFLLLIYLFSKGIVRN